MRAVCFHLGRQQFGADIGHVKETIILRPITRVFFTPTWIAGIINLRGDVTAVLDLKAFLGLGKTEPDGDTRILIARVPVGKQTRTAGILVDRLAEVRTLDPADLRPPPPTLPPDVGALTDGVAVLDGGEPLAVLDLVKLFESERLQQFRRQT